MDGISGIYSPKDKDLVHNVFLATGMNQHRGKACAGLAIGNGKGIYIHKGLGRIGNVIDDNIMRVFQDLNPVAAIGNVGYTKRRIPEGRNAEPIEIQPRTTSRYQVIITMDGHLARWEDIKTELDEEYYIETGNETELIGSLLHKYISQEGINFEAGRKLTDKLHGRATFALAALIYDGKETHMLTLNDDRAFEPFCYGTIDQAFVVSSESCSHRRLGGNIEREYDGAEMTLCSSDGIETKRLRDEKIMPDVFQGIYFGHVGSLFRGKEIFQIRKELGLGLIEHYGISEANLIIPNPESGWGVTMGIFEGFLKQLRANAFDETKTDAIVKDKDAFERYMDLTTVYPALIKQAQAVRTFQESIRRERSMHVGLKFGGIDSLLKGKHVIMGDDSIVKGSVSEGGSLWQVYNSGANILEFWISYGPMIFPSFKEWYRGEECLHELAVQRAFKDRNPYEHPIEDINKAVARLIGVEKVRYNPKTIIRNVTGSGSFQALDASYPIDEKFWPDWLKKEVERFQSKS